MFIPPHDRYFREIQGSQISYCNSPRSEPDLISEPSGCSFDIILLLSLFGLVNYCFFGKTRPGLWACVGTWYNSISISILPKDDFEKPPVASMNYTYHQKRNTKDLTREFIPLIKGFRCCWWFCPLKKMEFSSERSPPPFFLSSGSGPQPDEMPWNPENWDENPYQTGCEQMSKIWLFFQILNDKQNCVIGWEWAWLPVNLDRDENRLHLLFPQVYV